MTIGLWLGTNTTGADLALNDSSYIEIIELDLGYGNPSDRTVVGSVRLHIEGTKDQMAGEVQGIQKYLQKAIDYSATGMGSPIITNEHDPVYLYIRLHGTTDDVNRSPLINARYGMTPASIYQWNHGCTSIEYFIDFERLNYWEGAQETVPLTTYDVDDSTSQVTLYNPSTSGTIANYIEIASADIDGDLPGSLKLKIQNKSGAALSPIVFHMGQWTKSDEGYPQPHDVILIEAENGVFTDPADEIAAADASNGNYISYSETYPVVAPIELAPIYWSLAKEELEIYNGRYYKFLMYLYDTTGADDNNYQLRLKRGSTVIYEGPTGRATTAKGSVTTNIRDLGIFRLPPYNETLIGSPHPLIMELVITPADSSVLTGAVKVDYILALPTDGYRYIQSIGSVAADDYIIDDGTLGLLYGQHVDGTYPDALGFGNQLYLIPTYDNRIYFLFNDDTDFTFGVNAYYRPRRLSLGDYTAP